MRESFLPFALPDIGPPEMLEVQQVLESGWLTTGPKVQKLEKLFTEYLGVRNALALNSCTAAMHLALDAIGLGAGDFVFTSPYTFAASAEVIRYFDAIPVFVDVQPDTLNLDPVQLRDTVDDLNRVLSGTGKPQTPGVARVMSVAGRVKGRPRAVIPVHFAGHACDVDPLYETACQNNLAFIEDAAHSLPASYKGRLIGSPLNGVSPVLTCFSFYATKTITTGEGGMIVTQDDALAERCRIMSLHGISKDAWKRYTAEGSWFYEIIAPGFKYNLSDLAAAVGVAQFQRMEEMLKRRRTIADRYNTSFARIPQLQHPVERENCRHAWHLYVLRLNQDHFAPESPGALRKSMLEDLKARKIGSSVHFIPLHIHPYYRDIFGYKPEDFPNAYHQYLRAFSLPIYSRMSDRDIDDVVETVAWAVEKNAKRT